MAEGAPSEEHSILVWIGRTLSQIYDYLDPVKREKSRVGDSAKAVVCTWAASTAGVNDHEQVKSSEEVARWFAGSAGA